MAQAKTFSKAELKQLFDVTNSCSRYAARDATMLLFTHLCGLRISVPARITRMAGALYASSEIIWGGSHMLASETVSNFLISNQLG